MRFLADGPDFPDDLLTARDEGKVIFFCGAGVSQARVGLPNFVSLAGGVIDTLGSATDSPARRLFERTRAFEKRSGVTGVVPTDRIFSMLDREFDPVEVRTEVARALKPKVTQPPLDAHQIVARISTGPDGFPRIVTTNFDLLFEECDRRLANLGWGPPMLPMPRRPTEFRGVIHIHGRVATNYEGVSEDELILSSQDFGRAYLSEGWATRYIQSMLEEHKLVFLGYSADDPPVRYLLEALSDRYGPKRAMYAFSTGQSAGDSDQWSQKGVVPILSANYDALWRSLEAWATRADDLDEWYRSALRQALDGPKTMAPHQRGMVAHTVTSKAGLRQLLRSTPRLPAQWLCVLDPQIRYAAPSRLVRYDETTPLIDPFDLYGLDSDKVPSPPEARDGNEWLTGRPIPPDAWDLLEPMGVDFDWSGASRIRGTAARSPASLPPRLRPLASWIIASASEPVTLWWAARQKGLHPSILKGISLSLRRGELNATTAEFRKRWRMVIEALEEPPRVDVNFEHYEISDTAARDGWSGDLIRRIAAMYRPHLTVSASDQPPEDQDGASPQDYVGASVEYTAPHTSITLPVEFRRYELSLFRELLAHAGRLEREINDNFHLYTDTLTGSATPLREDEYGVIGLVNAYLLRFGRLIESDIDEARREAIQLSNESGPIFDRIRIWLASRTEIWNGDEVAAFFKSLTDEIFWSSQHDGDIRHALAARWSELPLYTKRTLGRRLLRGRIPWTENNDNALQLAAYDRLNRLYWLRDHGIHFSFNFQLQTEKLRRVSPEWNEARMPRPNGVVESFEIRTDSNPAGLLALPASKILSEAHRLEGLDLGARTHRDPFLGVVESQPELALRAINAVARRGIFDAEAWRALLRFDEKEGLLRPRLSKPIGRKLVGLASEDLGTIAAAASDWLKSKAKALTRSDPELFDAVWAAIVFGIGTQPDAPRTGREVRWVDQGLNRAAGRLAYALLEDDSEVRDRDPGDGLPERWSRNLNELLGLPGDHHRHALAIIAPRTAWLYQTDPGWVERNIIPMALGRGDDANAFWAGFFWGARAPQPALYALLKGEMLERAKVTETQASGVHILAGILLSGWRRKAVRGLKRRDVVTSVELRNTILRASNEFRRSLLDTLGQWTAQAPQDWEVAVLRFLNDVWPKQQVMKTTATSIQLTRLAIRVPGVFPAIVRAILPRIVPFNEGFGTMTDILQNGLVSAHPAVVVDLLSAILPQDSDDWPLDTARVLDALAGEDAVANSASMAELQRRRA